MGQYYNVLTCKNGNYKVYDRSYYPYILSDNEYMLAKLTEHSWIENSTMQSISSLIYQNPMKIAWVGDYSDGIKKYDITNPKLTVKKILMLYKIAWNDEDNAKPIVLKHIATDKTLLVNWDKKEYINMKNYIEKNSYNGWCMHPLSLLTAIGNGYGGGDYYGINKEKIGMWAYDKISFENEEMESYLKFNKLFTSVDIEFYEEWQKKGE